MYSQNRTGDQNRSCSKAARWGMAILLTATYAAGYATGWYFHKHKVPDAVSAGVDRTAEALRDNYHKSLEESVREKKLEKQFE